MTESRYAVVVARGDDEVNAAVVNVLTRDGWIVETDPSAGDGPVDGIVYLPGLLDGAAQDCDPASDLLALTEQLHPRLAGTRVVAVGSRDWLGWSTRPRTAAQAAGLIATVRSLALAHGRAGVTVNAVVGVPDLDDGPSSLTAEPVSAKDVAATVAFFLDPRSAYITGQVLHCCGGASLLSSLSV